MFGWLRLPIYRYVALDLGTANSLLYAKDGGIVMNEPSVVVIKNHGQIGSEIIAIGTGARPLLGRSSRTLTAVRPLRDGVIGDFEGAAALIGYALSKQARRTFFTRTRLLVGVPAGATAVERRAICESAMNAGVSHVYLVEEGVAAAIGAGLDIFDPTGSMVIDVGGGTIEVTAFSLGSIVYSSSTRVAGDRLDDAIISFIRRQFNALIGEQTAEKIKFELGAAIIDDTADDGPFVEVTGRDLLTGKPKILIIGKRAIFEALQEPITQMLDAIQIAIESVPAEVVADLASKGVIMTGGGALLQNLDKIISAHIEMPIFVAEDPLLCVARGLGAIIEDINKYKAFYLDIG